MSQNHLFSTYISPLDSLVFDSIVEPNKPSDDLETEANLALWVKSPQINMLSYKPSYLIVILLSIDQCTIHI